MYLHSIILPKYHFFFFIGLISSTNSKLLKVRMSKILDALYLKHDPNVYRNLTSLSLVRKMCSLYPSHTTCGLAYFVRCFIKHTIPVITDRFLSASLENSSSSCFTCQFRSYKMLQKSTSAIFMVLRMPKRKYNL